MAIKVSSSMGLGKSNIERRPILNEILSVNRFAPFSKSGSSSVLTSKREFWRWFKSRPELNSPVSARVRDTIKAVDFCSLDGSPLGRNKLIEANKFWNENFMDERLESIWFDAIVTGSGFGWIGKFKTEQLKEATDKVANKLKIDIKEFRDRLFLKAMDEDLRKPRKFDYVASSTMLIEHDDFDITGYTQQSMNTKLAHFTPEEIIHFPFMRLDGRVDGYSPIESLSSEMILLWFIKENMISYVRNGGLPKKVFSLPEESANGTNHEFLVQTLSNYGAVENRHGNLVLTGKVDIVDLEEKMRDMEYEQMAKWVTGNIAYAIQLPPSRLPYNLDGSAKSDAGGLAEQGYWSMIESDQKRIENWLNTQLFNKLGFSVKFRRRYKIDDLRETQAMSMKADSIVKTQGILNSFGLELTPAKVLSMMDMQMQDTREMKAQPIPKSGLMNQNLLNNNQMNGDGGLGNQARTTAAVNNPKGASQNGLN